VSFRWSQTQAHHANRWREFLAEQRELFEVSGLPGIVADRSVFDEFLMEGFVEMPGGLAVGVACDLGELYEREGAGLGRGVALYVARFGEPGPCRRDSPAPTCPVTTHRVWGGDVLSETDTTVRRPCVWSSLAARFYTQAALPRAFRKPCGS